MHLLQIARRHHLLRAMRVDRCHYASPESHVQAASYSEVEEEEGVRSVARRCHVSSSRHTNAFAAADSRQLQPEDDGSSIVHSWTMQCDNTCLVGTSLALPHIAGEGLRRMIVGAPHRARPLPLGPSWCVPAHFCTPSSPALPALCHLLLPHRTHCHAAHRRPPLSHRRHSFLPPRRILWARRRLSRGIGASADTSIPLRNPDH
jgi:hypothetical protein